MTAEIERQPTLYIPIGNIGCGKSLLSKRFVAAGAVRCCSDDLLQMMHAGGYVKGLREVYHQLEDDVIGGSLTRGLDVYVDRTNMEEGTRRRWFAKAAFVTEKRLHRGLAPVKIVALDFGRGHESDLRRRTRKPRGTPFATWKQVFEAFQEKYEKPNLDEGFNSIIDIDNRKFKFFAFDFDGFIVENAFPHIGDLIPSTVQLMRRVWNNLHWFLILNTCREDRGKFGAHEYQLEEHPGTLTEAIAYMKDLELPCDFVNCNPWYGPDGRKMFAHYYLDDRNFTVEQLNEMIDEEEKAEDGEAEG